MLPCLKSPFGDRVYAKSWKSSVLGNVQTVDLTFTVLCFDPNRNRGSKGSDKVSAQERRVKNVAEYLEQVSRIKEQWRNSVLAFRGQEDKSWRLESSAERRLKNSIRSQARVPDQLFIEYHKDLLEKCKLKNYDKREGKSLSELQLLADLQHHGSATCLIDFTRSALVALWFACEKIESDKDGKVFVVNTADNETFLEIAPDDIDGKSIEDILGFKTRETHKTQATELPEQAPVKPSQSKPDFLEAEASFMVPAASPVKPSRSKDFWYWTPAHVNERITAQHSLFLFGLPSSKEPKPKEEILIESASKEQIRQELKAIHDIHEEFLFPDFAGFAYTQRHNAPYDVPDAEKYFRYGVEAHQRGDLDRAIQDHKQRIDRLT